MEILLERPGVEQLDSVVQSMRKWPRDNAPIQLHVGDIGWHWRFGADVVARDLRVWRVHEQVFAVGLLDSTNLLRLAVDPRVQEDHELLRRILSDIEEPTSGVLPSGQILLEARCGVTLEGLLEASGWVRDEPWTPLSLDLASPLPEPTVEVEVIGPERASVRCLVQRSAFANSTFSEDRWHTMSAGPAYEEARCLVAHGANGEPVAGVTVWSAGAGRPGLIEPLGVHRDHRGKGYGRQICVAGARALRDLGSSSALVCTSSDNTGAVATYLSAGFSAQPESRDWRRDPVKVQ